MPFGCFFLIFLESKLEKKVLYVLEGSPEVRIGDNELLKIRSGHLEKKFLLTPLSNYQFYSIKEELKENKQTRSFIGGIILSKDEEQSTGLKDPLQGFLNQMMEERNKNLDILQESIKNAYETSFQQKKDILDIKELEKRLTDKVKALTIKGKFDDANLLLDKMKKIPNRLMAAYQAGEECVKRKDYEKAEKEYENAAKLAEELDEKDLVKFFKDRAKIARRIPDLLKRREDYLSSALQSLRNDNFMEASKFFKLAGEVSSELMDSRHAEEYTLKAKILGEYVKVDSKFKK